MIKKLKVKNYKSLRDVEIELDKFTVLIGPNASGKSNILDALMFLSESAREDNIGNLTMKRGDIKHVLFGGKEDSFELSVELLLGSKSHNYFLRINNHDDVEFDELSVDNEISLHREHQNFQALQLDKTNYGGYATQNKTALRQLGYGDNVPSAQDTVNFFNSWKLYQMSASDMRKTIPAKKSFDLEKNGANIAQVLISLHNERPKLFERIQDILKQGIPEVDELLTPLTTDGNTYIAIRERSFTRAFDYYQLSDGTIKLLAYITAVTLPESNVICFEEPENFIHPGLLQLLVEILKKSEKQVILSTHSPYFIDFVEPEDIRVVEKVDGETRVSKIGDVEKLKEALKEIELGELWYSGQFGGTP